jgi:hypothetical protein
VKLFFRIKQFNLRQQIYVIRNFYHRPRFALADLALGLCSLFFNPYRICKTTYGETPIRTFCHIVEAANLSSEDQYLELGSGRGKTCFWAALFIGCKAKGVEAVPLFARLSQALFKEAIFVCGSMFETDLSQADVIYSYHLEEKQPCFETMKPGSRLITISEPLDSPAFDVIKSLDVEFPWGMTQAYVQKRKTKNSNN